MESDPNVSDSDELDLKKRPKKLQDLVKLNKREILWGTSTLQNLTLVIGTRVKSNGVWPISNMTLTQGPGPISINGPVNFSITVYGFSELLLLSELLRSIFSSGSYFYF